MTMDTKKGGLLPATQTISLDGRKTVRSPENDDSFALLCIAAKRTPDADYSTDWRHAPHQTTIPTYWKGVEIGWITPQEMHTDDAPFCAVKACQCHHDTARMERYFIGPVSRGEMEIAEAIDRYHAEPGYMARKQAEARAREAVGV